MSWRVPTDAARARCTSVQRAPAHRRPLLRVAGLTAIAALLGCTDLGNPFVPAERVGEDPVPSHAADIQPIWNRACTNCHGFNGGMTLEGDAYDRIVNVRSLQNPALDRIEPGDPDASYLFRKLQGCSGARCIGDRMPQGGVLPDGDLQRIRAWIQGGAPR
jgi:hypothetical protein